MSTAPGPASSTTWAQDRGGRPALGDRPACFAQAGPCRQLSVLGIVSLSLGALAMATGAGLLATPDQPIQGEPAYLTSYQPPGVVMAGMGLGVLLTGVLMIVAGQRAHKLFRPGAEPRLPSPREAE